MEIMSAFGDEDGLKKFKHWLDNEVCAEEIANIQKK